MCEIWDSLALSILFKLFGCKASALGDTHFSSMAWQIPTGHDLGWAGVAPASVTNKTSATRTHQHSTWLPNVRHKVACGCLLFAKMKLISEQDKHACCFPISGGQPTEVRLSACLTEITYPEGLCKHTHSHVLRKQSLQAEIESGETTKGTYRAKIPFLKFSNSIISTYINRFYYNLCLKVG